jgi:hypothetical protein
MLRNRPKGSAAREPLKLANKPVKHIIKRQPHLIVPRQDAPGCPIQRLEGASGGVLGYSSKLYHRTNRVAARRIMRHGFKDSTNYYMQQHLQIGVWLSSVPLDFNKGASGQVLLQVQTDLRDSELAKYEWITKKQEGYREWLVPAAVVNPRMTVSVIPE